MCVYAIFIRVGIIRGYGIGTLGIQEPNDYGRLGFIRGL